MRYENVSKGIFLSRPNRFVAWVELEGRREKVHVKNTGRCMELLIPGCEVWLAASDNPERLTAYDLIAVNKGGRIVNIDSQAPNKAVLEWLSDGNGFDDILLVKPEVSYGSSRFDFYVEASGDRIWLEVKGVTLERDNVLYFPDAPSLRALKHVEELIQSVRDGNRACIFFIIQMEGAVCFKPNRETQPVFADALVRAQEAGVEIRAYECAVAPDEMHVVKEVPVELTVTLNRIASPLLAWYDGSRRILPWREEPAAYRVWISEIMLQQTRVEAVKPYYERFMRELPNVEALAAVDEERLMKLWEGLGYYSRARNLKKAACRIMEEYGGRIPDTFEELLCLPGIGSYTAGAIASIAWSRAVPAVDGNVLRVISRLRMDDRDILNASVKRSVEKDLEAVMPKERPGDFNQALMELGATVCLPGGRPDCMQCPWEQLCLAHKSGRELDFPRKAAKKPRKVENRTILLIQKDDRCAIRRRPETGLLAGLYEFPGLEGTLDRQQVEDVVRQWGMEPESIRKLPPARHVFSHREWNMTGYVVTITATEDASENGLLFVDTQEARDRYSIPSAFAAYAAYLKP